LYILYIFLSLSRRS